MIQYKIYTENRKLGWIKSILNQYFTGYTIYKTEGYYKGRKEKSLVIEIITENNQWKYVELRLRTLVKMLKGYGSQNEVLVIKNHSEAIE